MPFTTPSSAAQMASDPTSSPGVVAALGSQPTLSSPRRMARRDTLLDEYWTGVVTLPIVLAFVPFFPVTRVREGMEALGAAPDWFIQITLGAVLYAFGNRTLAVLPQLIPSRASVQGVPQPATPAGATSN